jgi:LysM repeat protein
MKRLILTSIIVLTFLILLVYINLKVSQQNRIYQNISATSTSREIENSISESNKNNQEIKYVIKKGDTLWQIAERYYGSGLEYKKIIEKNPGKTFKFGDGREGLIYEGTEIKI